MRRPLVDEARLRSPVMDWLERTAKLRQWTRGGTRAPHKPLLLLYALGRFQQDAAGELRYSAVEEDLQRLLTEYGPPNRTTPAYPFHHLVSCLLYTSPSPRDGLLSRMPSSA